MRGFAFGWRDIGGAFGGGVGGVVPLDPGLTSILTAAPGSTVLWPAPQYWFQDSAGTVPVTAEGQRIKCWIAQDGKRWVQAGADSLAPTAGKYPNGEWGALFSGGQSLVSQVAFDLSAQTQAALFIGARKTSDATNGVIIEQGPNATTSPGFNIFAPAGTIEYRQWLRVGTNNTSISFDSNTYAAPHTAALTGLFTTGTQQVARVNGTEQTTTAAAGNLASDVIYLGARAGANSFFNGLIGPVVLRGGALPDGAAVASIEATITAKVGAADPAPSQIADFYGTGAGQIPMRLQSSTAILSGANVQYVPNAGGAGTAFDLFAGTAAITMSGAALDLTPDEYLRYTNQTQATAPDLMNTTVFIVADVTLGAVDQYFMGNGSPQANVWLTANGSQMRFNRRNPITASFENVTVNLSPVVTAGNRIHEVEFIPGGAPNANGQTSGGSINVRVNGVLRGTAVHTYPEFRVWNFSAGQNPSNGNGLQAKVYDLVSMIRGGDHDTRVPTVRSRLNDIYAVGL